MDKDKSVFREFVEVSKDTLDRLPKNIFVTEEPDPAKAIPAMIAAVREGGAVAAVWLHDYWAEERAQFKSLESAGPIDVKYTLASGVRSLRSAFNEKAAVAREKLEARIRERHETLENIARQHCDPDFCEYLINGGLSYYISQLPQENGALIIGVRVIGIIGCILVGVRTHGLVEPTGCKFKIKVVFRGRS